MVIKVYKTSKDQYIQINDERYDLFGIDFMSSFSTYNVEKDSILDILIMAGNHGTKVEE